MENTGDFFGGPKNLPFNAGNTGSIPGRELKSRMLSSNEAHVPQLLKPVDHS